MRKQRMQCVVLGAAMVLLPMTLAAQIDTNGATGMGQQNGQTGMQGTTTQVNQTGTIQTGSMHDSLGAPGETGQQMMDKQFVRRAVEGGLGDVELGKLATVKGSDAVKQLAQQLVDDHVAMNKDLDTVADSMGVMLPKKMSKEAQKEYDALNGLAGKDFDTEYVTYTAKAHFAELHSFHMEASVAASPELTTEVVKGMGMMHRHVGLIVNVAKEQAIVLPPRPQRRAPVTASK